MGVYADAYSVVVRNEIVEIAYPGGLEGYEDATIYYRACLVTAGDNLSLLLELTLCLGEQGYNDEARDLALLSIKVAPDSAEAWGNLAGSSMQLGMRGEARAALDRALDIDPDNVINLGLDKEFESFFAA